MGAPGLGRVYTALIAVQAIFGVHYIAAKVLLAEVPPPAWAVFRLGSATLLFAGVYLARGGGAIPWREHGRLAVLALFGVVVNQICFVEGLSRTTPAHSSLINTTIPVATLLFAVLMGREPLRRSSAAGIFLALAGVLVLVRVDDLELRAEWFVGDLLTLVNACSFAFFLVISRPVIRRLGSMRATAYLLAWGTLGVAAYGGADAAALPASVWTPKLLALGAYIVVFPTVIAYFLNYWALGRVESSIVALFVYLQPILGGGLSVWFLDEPFMWWLVVSSIFVFVGVLFTTRRTRNT